ncbi:hypothetical protein K474DRAFT_1654962 [Panus rudis PR-1116 ss-1]|nr:hypothetical protein K474DRAFT_1654962 [Panus rudis PR-1116 ss-1]
MSPNDGDFLNGRIPATRNGAPSPLPSVSLSREHILEALAKSPDSGATLDLTHKNLTDVGEDGAEELATLVRDADENDSTVARIALAHNRLATLPMAFSLLSRLRYLVLKNNNFTVFPDVLTVMPSLEILDISRNKIKRLPSQPGTLTRLRIFSIARNKIHRIPPYFTQFRELTLFKADQNPLTWPPKSVMDAPSSVEGPAMKDWILSVQKWMESQADELERKGSDDSVLMENTTHDFEGDFSLDDSQASALFSHDSQYEQEQSFHTRSFSIESDASIYSDMANLHAPSRRPTQSPGPSRLRLDVPTFSRSASTSVSPSPIRSPASYLPTPDESTPSAEEDTVTGPGRLQRGQNQSHSRNGSSLPSRPPTRQAVLSQKSLPELRSPSLPDTFNERALPSPPHRQESDPNQHNLPTFHRSRILAREAVSASPISVDRPAPPMDVERNSYFRRFSTLTNTPTSKTIPEPLLKLVDAIRGVLFAVSQIYQTLQYYTVYSTDERLSAVLLKVLDPASLYLHQLIDALDRFDATSRRSLPSPPVCRAVVESCRDNVIVFRKAVDVLSLQLKVLATHDDVRYTRHMLLVLYGAAAEIASSWQTISANIEAVRPLLHDHRPPPVKQTFTAQTPTILTSAASPLEAAVSPPATAPPAVTLSGKTPVPLPRPSLRSHTSHSSADLGKQRVSRRHAGSFSLKDVEIGKNLPSYVDVPHFSAGVAETSSAPTLRAARRAGNLPASAGANVSASFGNGPVPASALPARWDSHSRTPSSSSLAQTTASPSLGMRSMLDASSTSTLVDREAIDAMKVAVDSAPVVWEMMDEILVDSPELKEELSGTLTKAKETTEKLRMNIQALENDDSSADRVRLRDDAHIFVKTVIQLSNTIKAHGTAHPLSSALRTNMVKLTNATQEFVILLHVSSFSPAPTPRPYSPMIKTAGAIPQRSATAGSLAGTPVDDMLGANLSRSRSAAPKPTNKFTQVLREAPRSALPHQSFKIPTPPRFGISRSRSGQEAVPG